VYVASNRRSPAESREDISSILPSAFADRAPESREILLKLRIEPATFRPPFVRHHHCATCLKSRRTKVKVTQQWQMRHHTQLQLQQLRCKCASSSRDMKAWS
jgi:hypothetical protein